MTKLNFMSPLPLTSHCIFFSLFSSPFQPLFTSYYYPHLYSSPFQPLFSPLTAVHISILYISKLFFPSYYCLHLPLLFIFSASFLPSYFNLHPYSSPFPPLFSPATSAHISILHPFNLFLPLPSKSTSKPKRGYKVSLKERVFHYSSGPLKFLPPVSSV